MKLCDDRWPEWARNLKNVSEEIQEDLMKDIYFQKT